MSHMRKTGRAIILLLILLIAVPFQAFAAGAPSAASDIGGHWAEKELSGWIGKGLLSGYEDGTFQPDRSISRAEFFALVNRSFRFTQEASVSFADLDASHWAVAELKRAKAAGYADGYPDGTIRPDRPISREEAAVVLRSVLKLQEDAAKAGAFQDAAQFADWSKGSIGALAAKGYLSGYEDGTYKPGRSMTRAEMVAVLDRAVADAVPTTVYDAKGTYGPESGTTTIAGNVTISAPGVTLRNTVIEGDLLLAESIGEGDVFLKNVTVKGATTVNGGGARSVHFEDSVLLTVIVNKADGSIRIVAEGSTSVQQFTVQSSALLESRGTSTIADVVLSSLLPSGAQVSMAGQFNSVDVQATSVRVSLTEGAIQQLTVSQGADRSTLQVGTGASVAQLVLNAAASVVGQGSIGQATVNANGSSFERNPGAMTTGEGVQVGVGTAAPSGGGSSDGGSSGDGSSDDDSGFVTGFGGKIVDVSNQPVAGMTIQFRRGLDNKDGDVVATVVTDAEGRYTVDLAPGIYTGELVKEGFITTYLIGVSASNVRNTAEDATAIRVAAANEIRIVLSWGERPRDLDSHLVGPTPTGGVFHTWYSDKVYTVGSVVYDDLDHDDTTSYGPETTTIRHTVDGLYRFYVHNYSGETNMRDSGAHIEVYEGSTTTPAKTYDIPTGTGTERYWTAFEMTIANGSIASFTDINQFYATESAAQGSLGAGMTDATVTSSVYGIDQNVREITVPANVPAESFKAGLSAAPGATLKVYQADGVTPRTDIVADGDKVVVRAADGRTSRTYTVRVSSAPTVTSLTYEPAGPIVLYDTTSPIGIRLLATVGTTVTDVTYQATYASNRPDIADIDPNGVITAVTSGSTVVSAVYGGLTKDIPVIVLLAPSLAVSSSDASTLTASGLVSGAAVGLYDASSDTIVGSPYTAGQDGTATIPAVPAGTYYIIQTYQGFESGRSATVTVN
ncbi:S-layer homology domain-containing protein [Paenibacillus flagellatus]|uniref:SLH domain-containing protein n=1 Tax=Paenibacillus flagellatus TaxID=2211139 RepID=A0A2V5JXC2_9BACL|nr:S-layer homology domain-containing protein [Paenibacillus flagellatus]PYI51489.1 hypothetical protein DLM86_23980 [Paenibacillus flagellatus]